MNDIIRQTSCHVLFQMEMCSLCCGKQRPEIPRPEEPASRQRECTYYAKQAPLPGN